MRKRNLFIVIMRGFTAVGKTSTARKVFRCLENTDIYHSAVVREELGLAPTKLNYRFDLEDPVFVKVISPHVYEEMTRKAKKSLEEHRNVILDAAYNFSWQRNQIYTIAKLFGADIYILWCVCTNEEEIRRRLGIRKEDQKSPFNEAPAWKTYISTVKYSEPVER